MVAGHTTSRLASFLVNSAITAYGQVSVKIELSDFSFFQCMMEGEEERYFRKELAHRMWEDTENR